jgi:hypothetical protein
LKGKVVGRSKRPLHRQSLRAQPVSTPSALPTPVKRFNASSSTKTGTKMFVVLGFGCDKFTNNKHQLQNNLRQALNPGKFDSVEVLCNEKYPKSMTKNIMKRLLSEILTRTHFVEDIAKTVCQELRANQKVVLIGHSYGGSVVARVAMYIRDICKQNIIDHYLKNLHVATFGSIYVPPPSNTVGINIKHFAYKNDIAKFCAKVCKKSTYLTLMEPRYRDPTMSHMDYYHIMKDIARTGRFPDGTTFLK